MTVRDSSGNPFIDYVWGNMPMQPNDDRDVELDPNLDNHIIATTAYQGFPLFTQGGIYDDTIPNVAVPDVINVLTGNAYSAVAAVGLEYSVTGNRTIGATAENDSYVYSQNPAPGTLVNEGTTVSTVIYEYVAPVTTGPISAIRYDAALPAGDYKMYLIGQTVKPTVGDSVTTTGNGNTFYNSITWEVMSVVNDDAYNTGGTKVILRNAAVVTTNEGIGGTWTKV